MFFFVWITSLSMIISRSISVAAHGIISFFMLRLSNIPLYTCTISLSIHLLMVASMSWLLWIILQWTLGCLDLFKLWFSLVIRPGVGFLVNRATLILVLKGTSILFSIVNFWVQQLGHQVIFFTATGGLQDASSWPPLGTKLILIKPKYDTLLSDVPSDFFNLLPFGANQPFRVLSPGHTIPR